jgi:hypothetical protein
MQFEIPEPEAVYLPPEASEPPMLVVWTGSQAVTFVPPTNRDDCEDFRGFLRELAEGAGELLLDCHPAGPWGRRMFVDRPGGR